MKSYRRKAPTRLIFAVALIISSFISAYLLSAAANRSQVFWVTKSILSPGMMITPSDLLERRAALDSIAGRYLTQDRPFKRLIVMAKVGAGELLPLSALSTDLENLQSSAVPVSFLSSDLPADLMTGEKVNLYQVGDPRLAGTGVSPALILNNVAILGIDRKGENLGSSVSLTLSVKKVDVLRLLTATSAGRLVAVRIYG